MNKGVSLIEMVVYLGLVAIIIPVAASLVFFSVDALARGEDANAVLMEGARLSQIFSQAIRNAEEINFPLLGMASSTLSLATSISAKNPIVFSFNNGTITLKEGVSAPVELTSENIIMTTAVFQNVSRAGTPGSVKIEFTLTSGPLTRNFYVSASLQ